MHPHTVRHPYFLPALLGAVVIASASAIAQTTSPSAPQSKTVEPVVSPTAFAPPVLYRSVFVDTPSGIETEEIDWRQANAEVGRFKRGHADILRWEQAQASKPTKDTKDIAPTENSTGGKP